MLVGGLHVPLVLELDEPVPLRLAVLRVRKLHTLHCPVLFRVSGSGFGVEHSPVQGYLAHKKTPTP